MIRGREGESERKNIEEGGRERGDEMVVRDVRKMERERERERENGVSERKGEELKMGARGKGRKRRKGWKEKGGRMRGKEGGK